MILREQGNHWKVFSKGVSSNDPDSASCYTPTPSFHLVVHLLCISPQILWFLLFYLHHINNSHIFIKVGGHDATGLLCLLGLTSALSAVRLSPSVRVQPDAREQGSLLKRWPSFKGPPNPTHCSKGRVKEDSWGIVWSP